MLKLNLLKRKLRKEHRSKPPQGGLEVTPQLMRSETNKQGAKNEQRKTSRDPFKKIFE
jgi:hypothetical protein